MSAERIIQDLSVWWIQASIVGAAAAVSASALRLPAGGGKLLYWQTVLCACLLLPVIAVRPTVAVTMMVHSHARMVAPAAAPQSDAMVVPWAGMAVAVIVAGLLLRAGLFLSGFTKLWRYRRASVPSTPGSSWSAEADIRLSEDVTSPVTFGIRRPVILLPMHFPRLPVASQEAILCHEVLHVRRRDWLFTVGEEMVRAALWFHPAIWWIVNEIRLAREQTVDAAVVDLLNRREEYVDALLTVSGAGAMDHLAGAPLFLRKRQLKQRLISILKEHSMSKTQRLSSFTAGFVLLAGACWVATAAFPLTAAPQFVNDAPGVTVNLNGNTLMHRTGVDYPPSLSAEGIEGNVQVQVKLDASGNVADASVLSGPDALRKAVLQSVLGWHFSHAAANSTRQIGVTFEATGRAASPQVVIAAPPAPPAVRGLASGSFPRIAAIDTIRLSAEAHDELLAQLPVHTGDIMTPDALGKVMQIARQYDEHLAVLAVALPTGEVRLSIVSAEAPQASRITSTPPAAAEGAFRVGGSVQAANVVQKVAPVYPQLAKDARVQGTVRFDALIGKDGSVENLNVISGPPLLIQAAMAAVQQWQYRPTLLNGQPVRVATTIDINFTLAEAVQ